MKTLALIVVLMLIAICCRSKLATPSAQTLTPTLDPSRTRTFVWSEAGMTLTLLEGWRRDDDGEPNRRGWTSQDSSDLSIHVDTTGRIVGDDIKVMEKTIDDDTSQFYDAHKGEEDLRYITIDGVKGVQYLRDDKSWHSRSNADNVKVIIWNGQRIYGQLRQLITVNLSTPVEKFATNRDLLYGLLGSIKFSGNQGGPSPSATETSDNPPVFVAIVSDAEIYFKKKRIERGRIGTEVDRVLRDLPSGKQIYYIKASLDVKSATVIGVRDEVGAFGYDQVGLVTPKNPKTGIGATATPHPLAGKTGSPQKPDSKNNEAQVGPVIIHIGVSQALEKIKINDEDVSLRQLSNKIRVLLDGIADNYVIVRTGGNVPYGSLKAVIDEVKAAGIEQIVLELEKD